MDWRDGWMNGGMADWRMDGRWGQGFWGKGGFTGGMGLVERMR